MKKILKIGILFLIVFALAVAAFAAYTLLKKDDAPKSDETVFDRAPLDKDSVFGDYVFEEKVRDALNLGKEDKIDTAKLLSVTELDLSYNGPSTTTDYCILSRRA